MSDDKPPTSQDHTREPMPEDIRQAWEDHVIRLAQRRMRAEGK